MLFPPSFFLFFFKSLNLSSQGFVRPALFMKGFLDLFFLNPGFFSRILLLLFAKLFLKLKLSEALLPFALCLLFCLLKVALLAFVFPTLDPGAREDLELD